MSFYCFHIDNYGKVSNLLCWHRVDTNSLNVLDCWDKCIDIKANFNHLEIFKKLRRAGNLLKNILNWCNLLRGFSVLPFCTCSFLFQDFLILFINKKICCLIDVVDAMLSMFIVCSFMWVRCRSLYLLKFSFQLLSVSSRIWHPSSWT